MPEHKITLETLSGKLDGIEKSIKKVENFVDSQNRQGTVSLRLYLESNFHRRPSCRIFRHKKAFDLCTSMLAENYTYEEIARTLSNIRGFGRISKSSVGRFRDLYMGIIRER